MSMIRKNTSDAMIQANRANSLKSTGPLTDVGKINVRLNGLKHGITSGLAGMCVPALDEREADLKYLARRLALSFRPEGSYEEMLVDQMVVENRWRRQRTVRAEAGLLAEQVLNFELEYGRNLAGEGRSAEASGEATLAATLGLAALPDSSAKFSLILQCLRAAAAAVEREGFGQESLSRLQAVYGPEPGLAGAALLSAYHQQEPAASGEPDSAATEHSGDRQAFLDALGAEIACFEKLQELHEKSHDELARARWHAQSALSENDSRRITRYEAFLDRQFDGLLKQLQEHREERRQDAKAFGQAAVPIPPHHVGGSQRYRGLEVMEEIVGGLESFGGTGTPPRRSRPHQDEFSPGTRKEI